MFCAIHAIELYLNAQIRDAGGTPELVRGYRHRLGEMSAHEAIAALNLRKKTRDHLGTMTAEREYLVVRYAPDQKAQCSELTRLTATLEEVATKVGSAMDRRTGSRTEKAG